MLRCPAMSLKVVSWLLLAASMLLSPLLRAGQDEERKEPRAGFSRALQFNYETKGGVKRERRVFLWYPTTRKEVRFRYGGQQGMIAPEAPVKEGAHPLIIFSHGFCGAADQSVFLMESLARAGYVVASVHHEDAMHAGQRKRTAMPNFLEAKEWQEDKFIDRREDMVALLNFVLGQNGLEGSLLHKRLVPGMVGGAGHSLGGYALVGMAGGRDSWREERVGAILLLSPYVLPYLHHGSLKGVTVPVMVQGGTWDLGVTPFLKRFYDQLESAKYYLVLRGAGHFAWTDLNSAGSTTTEALKKGNPRLIAEYSIAFFDRHLKELDRRKALVARGKQVHTWRANGKAE